jgi:hypothetical protein
MRNLQRYSGATTLLIWVGVVVFSITFWAGLACLIAHLIRNLAQ